jgi:FkbM family methyltransferase
MQTKGAPLLDRLAYFMRRRGMRGVGTIRRAASGLVTTREITAQTTFGSRFRLRTSDYIDNVILNEGYYESEVLEAMRAGVPEGATVWDVGANFGLHCITLKRLRPDLRVVAFEPSPQQAGRIIENAELNGLTIEVLAFGLSDEAAIRQLHVMHEGNPGVTTFTPWQEFTYDAALYCQTETGDRLIEAGIAPSSFLIKIDVEGGEEAAFAGLAAVLSGVDLKRIIFEGGPDLAASVGRRGFTVRELGRQEDTAHCLHNYVAQR